MIQSLRKLFVSFSGGFFICFLSGCVTLPIRLPEAHYWGMTREQVAYLTEDYPKVNGNILIFRPSGFYFKTPADILSDKAMMCAKTWGVNYRKVLWTARFYELTFENDRVVNVSKKTINYYPEE